MHPPRFKHARSLHAVVAMLVLVGGGAVLPGCGGSSGRPEAVFAPTDSVSSAVERDSALAVLTSMQRAAFDSAFAGLGEHAVTRYVRTEQLSTEGAVTALRTYVLRYPSGRTTATIRRSDSAGTFRGGGLLGRVAPDRAPTEPPPNMAEQMLPDQPAYVEPRTREAFRYALQADTLRDGEAIYVLEARARSHGPGREQGIRHARLLIERGSRQLVGLTTVRSDEGLLFSEHSRLVLRLRKGPAGAWVPDVSRVRAALDVPFRPPRQFRTVSAYYQYR